MTKQIEAKQGVPKWLRVTLGALLVLVLVVGFLGYLTPSMRVNWEAIASMCGF